MKPDKEAHISYLAHHITTIVSVTLVLLLIGIISMVWISADTETRRLKQQIELSVIMSDTVPDGSAKVLADELRKQPYINDIKVVTRQEALQQWKADTGEDLMELFGVNPLSEEVDFTVKADYASAAWLAKISTQVAAMPGVEEVARPDSDMIDSMNRNISKLTVILGVIAVIMLVISFVLINNTVHLTIYSRRFTIHTMQLVGATNGFIRRPIVINNLLAGLVAGLIASAVMAVALASSGTAGFPDMTGYIGWGAYGIVAGGITIIGMALCSLAAVISANIYLRKDYDALFR